MVVLERVTVIVHSSIARVNVRCRVVMLRVLKDQVVAVMVPNVIPVVVIIVEETVKIVVVHLNVILLDVIHHVIIGV